MTPAPQRPWLAALLGRLGDQLADPAQIAVLQERLQRHGAELQGQLPELLLRSPDPQASIEAWLMGRDLSHWQPQAWGGSATDGWQFEAAGLNRARGLNPSTLARSAPRISMAAWMLCLRRACRRGSPWRWRRRA